MFNVEIVATFWCTKCDKQTGVIYSFNTDGVAEVIRVFLPDERGAIQ